MDNENWEDLADKLGLSKELLEQMGIEQLTVEQLRMLNTIINLHSNDQQSLNEFLKETGLDNILSDLPDLKQEDVENENDFENLIQQIENIASKKDVDL